VASTSDAARARLAMSVTSWARSVNMGGAAPGRGMTNDE